MMNSVNRSPSRTSDGLAAALTSGGTTSIGMMICGGGLAEPDPAPERVADPAPEPVADPAPEPAADPAPEPAADPLPAAEPPPAEPIALPPAEPAALPPAAEPTGSPLPAAP